MPVNIPQNLPAINILKKENIFVFDQLRANQQDIRPLRVLVLNLMPIKITTETDIIRLLSNNPLQVEIDFLKLETHESKNTPEEHLIMFYKGFSEIKNTFYDGMIITGAPVELFDFKEVDYWPEITKIFDWARTHVTSTLYICWAAQAAMFHFYGVNKVTLKNKMFGVFKHIVRKKDFTLFRGFDDEFNIPVSRHTTVKREDILLKEELTILAESNESGVGIICSRGGRELYFTGHSEYSPYTLHNEYIRDLEKGLPIEVPHNYYRGNDPQKGPIVTWKAHANLLFNNWLNYFVYQETPYKIEEIENMGEIIQPNNDL